MRTRTLIAVLMFSLLLPLAATAQELPPGGTFTDDNGNSHEGFIEAIAAEGVTSGCNPPDGDQFCPADSVTRAQMAAFLVRALGLVEGGSIDYFTDDDQLVFQTDINRLAHAGITSGCNPPDNDEFCPLDPVTRGQMAAFLGRAFNLTEGGDVDYFTDDDLSVFQADINRLAFSEITAGCTATEYCPSALVRRDQMASFLGRAMGLTPIPVPPLLIPTLESVATGYGGAVDVDFLPGDDRMFITTTSGVIHVKDDAGTGVFLDISGPVISGGEMGLLSMEFHPDYPADPRIFVYYSGATVGSGDHSSYVRSFEVSGDPDVIDVGTGKTIITVDQPYSNHNGGDMHFGPDGYLYVGFGDGGSGNDPLTHGQDRSTLLGGMIRIDIDNGDPYAIPADNPWVNSDIGADELWAFGLRNPWRWSFDGDLLYIGDVGQGAWEEINVEPAAAPALNYGWRVWEGDSCTGLHTCTTAGFTFPAFDYSHTVGRSVTGGWVYQGDELEQLQGTYFYADFLSGWIKSFEFENGVATNHQDWTSEFGSVYSVSAFGRDADGVVYVVTFGGTIYRISPE